MKYLIFFLLLFSSCQKEPSLLGSWKVEGEETYYYIQEMVCIQRLNESLEWKCSSYRMRDNTLDIATDSISWDFELEGNSLKIYRDTVVVSLKKI